MAGHAKISLYFPDKHLFSDRKSIVLGGDAGGTKVNLAFFEATASGVKMLKSSSYQSGSFPTINKILQQFLSENPVYAPDKICLGVAGPVFEGRVSVTNLPWTLDANEIADSTGVSQVILLNDLEATAYGVAGLEETDFPYYTGVIRKKAEICPYSLRTGLGEAGLFWDGQLHIFLPQRVDIVILQCRNSEDLQLL
jgi:glucokinase